MPIHTMILRPLWRERREGSEVPRSMTLQPFSFFAPWASLEFSPLLRRGMVTWVLLAGIGALGGVSGLAQDLSSASADQARQEYESGIALIRRGNPKEASAAFLAGLKRDPSNLLLLNALGGAYTLQGRDKDARQCFRAALKIDPAFTPARKNLALSFFNSGESEAAAAEFERLESFPEARPLASLFLGLIAEKRREFGKAAELLEASGPLFDQQPQALVALAHSYYELRQPDKARLAFQRLNRLAKVAPGDYFQAGRVAYQQGEYTDALAFFDKANHLAPGLPELDYYRALVLVELGRTAEALSILRVSTTQHPDARALNLLGHLAQKRGDTQLAIQSFYQAGQLEPDMEANYLDYSSLVLDSENYTLALEILDAGLAHIPHSYRLLVQKGAVLDKLMRRRDAEEVFRSAMKLQADNRVAWIGLAVTQAHDHRLNEAAETLSMAIERFPADAYSRYYHGLVLVQLAERQDMKPEVAKAARRELEKAIQLDPGYADTYYQLAKTYLQTDVAKAAEQLEACLRHQPDHYAAEMQLGRLYLRMGRQAEGERLLGKAARDKQAENERENKLPRIEKFDSSGHNLTTLPKEELP